MAADALIRIIENPKLISVSLAKPVSVTEGVLI
jgi:hypothetical protein